jgi:S1-C subfamily serine protease
MRRIPALLCVAGLAAAPTGAVAGPSRDASSTARAQTLERFEWSTSKGRLGVMVTSLTPELREHFGAPADRGVLVALVDPATPAAKAGLAVGDVIVGIRGQKIDTATEVLSAVEAIGPGERIEIEVVRKGSRRSLHATLTDHPLAKVVPFPWLPEWLRPSEPTTPDPEAKTSAWLRELRELFAPKKATPDSRS